MYRNHFVLIDIEPHGDSCGAELFMSLYTQQCYCLVQYERCLILFNQPDHSFVLLFCTYNLPLGLLFVNVSKILNLYLPSYTILSYVYKGTHL